MRSFKLIAAFLSGAVLAACVLVFFLRWTWPRVVSLSAESLKVSVVKLNGENFVAVTGPPFNALGAHQYLAYNVADDKVELVFFVTRLTLFNDGAFQSDWPLLIPQGKFLSQRVRLTCKSRSGEELIAIVLLNGDVLEIHSNPSPAVSLQR
jgi:hypothetical protein